MSEGKYSHLAKMHKALSAVDSQLDKLFDAVNGNLVRSVEISVKVEAGKEPQIEYLIKTNEYLLRNYGNES